MSQKHTGVLVDTEKDKGSSVLDRQWVVSGSAPNFEVRLDKENEEEAKRTLAYLMGEAWKTGQKPELHLPQTVDWQCAEFLFQTWTDIERSEGVVEYWDRVRWILAQPEDNLSPKEKKELGEMRENFRLGKVNSIGSWRSLKLEIEGKPWVADRELIETRCADIAWATKCLIKEDLAYLIGEFLPMEELPDPQLPLDYGKINWECAQYLMALWENLESKDSPVAFWDTIKDFTAYDLQDRLGQRDGRMTELRDENDVIKARCDRIHLAIRHSLVERRVINEAFG